MPGEDSFTEIVQFEWRTGDAETGAGRLLARLDDIEKKLGSVATASVGAFQTVARSFNPALSAADDLIAKLNEIIRLQGQLGSMPPPVSGTRSGRVDAGMGLYQYPNDAPDQYRDTYGRFASGGAGGQGIGAFNPNAGQRGHYRFGQSDWAAQGWGAPQAQFHILSFPDDLGAAPSDLGQSMPSAYNMGAGNVAAQMSANIREANAQFDQSINAWKATWTSAGNYSEPDSQALALRPGFPWGGANSISPGAGTPYTPQFPWGSGPSAASGATINGVWSGGYGMPPIPGGAAMLYPPNSGAYGGGGAGQVPLPGVPWYQAPVGGAGGPGGPGAAGGGAGGIVGPGGPFPAAYGPPGAAITPQSVTHATEFERILGRIVVTAALFAAFRVAAQSIAEMTEEMLRLEDVTARVGFINGQGGVATQYQFTQAGAAGIAPKDAAGGIITAAQLGSSALQQKQAQDLALVFGADQYNRALVELNQTQVRADAIGLKNVDVMNFIAQSYKTMPGTMADYFNALQQGIQLGAAFGVSAESMGLAIERTVRVSGQSVDFIANLTQSTLTKLQDKDVQKGLEKFGIQAGDPASMVSQIATRQREMAAAGDQGGIQKMMEAVQGGGLAGPARVRQLTILFQELDKAQQGASDSLAKFDGLLAGVSDTGVTKINQLTAAWKLFLQSVGDTKLFKETATGITDVLNAATAHNNLGEAWGSITPDQRAALVARFQSETGLKLNTSNQMGIKGSQFGTEADPPRVADHIGLENPINQFARQYGMDAWMLEAINALQALTAAANKLDNVNNSAEHDPPFVRGSKGKLISGVPDTKFGGFNTFDEKSPWTFDQFESKVRGYEKAIAGKGGYELDRRTEVYYDETTRTWRTMLADSNAIRYANEEMRKLMSEQITGTFNVPAGGEVSVLFNALTAGFRPSTYGLGSGASGGASGPDAGGLPKDSPRLIGTLDNLDAATRGVLDYLRAHGANVPGTSGRSIGTRGSGSGTYDPDHLKDDLYVPAGKSLSGRHPSGYKSSGHAGDDFDPYSARNPRFADKRQKDDTASATGMTINNRIAVSIDGRLLASYLNRQQFRQFENIRNANATAPNSSVMM